MTKTIDYLLHETPYTAKDICHAPFIFNYKLETIKKRITYIESMGRTNVALNWLMSVPVETVVNKIGDDDEP